MYIISGIFKGRKLFYSTKSSIRPSLARVRKMVLDTLNPLIINDHFQNISILDGFAGTGAYGFESLSIFGGKCTFFELDKELVKNLKQSALTMGLNDRVHIVMGNALVSLKKCSTYFNIVFLDPPYENTFLIGKMLRILVENKNIDDHSYIVVENSVHNRWNFIPEYFDIIKDKKAASTRFIIIKLNKDFILNKK